MNETYKNTSLNSHYEWSEAIQSYTVSKLLRPLRGLALTTEFLQGIVRSQEDKNVL